MAVDNKQRTKAKPFWLKRMVMNGLCITFLGWVILMGWALTIWIQENFERSFEAVIQLTARQAAVFDEFSDTSLLSWVGPRIDASWKIQAQQVLAKTNAVKGEITEATVHKLEDFLGHKEVAMTPVLQETVKDFQLKGLQFWLLFGVTAKLLLVKLAIIVAAIPLFLLAMTAGLVDGLNQRAIRKASLGRESTYVFHKSIPFARKALFWVLGLWLASPHALPPSPVFVSLSVLLSLVVSVSSSRFKKYL